MKGREEERKRGRKEGVREGGMGADICGVGADICGCGWCKGWNRWNRWYRKGGTGGICAAYLPSLFA